MQQGRKGWGVLGIGGAQKVLVTLANAWAERGWRVTLIAVGGSVDSYFPVHPRVVRRSLDLKAPSSTLASALRNNARRFLQLRRAVRASRPDVVLSFLSATNVLTIEANDPRSGTAEFKAAAVRIDRLVEAPTPEPTVPTV